MKTRFEKSTQLYSKFRERNFCYKLEICNTGPRVILLRYFYDKLDRCLCINDSLIIKLYLILRLEVTPIIALSNL